MVCAWTGSRRAGEGDGAVGGGGWWWRLMVRVDGRDRMVVRYTLYTHDIDSWLVLQVGKNITEIFPFDIVSRRGGEWGRERRWKLRIWWRVGKCWYVPWIDGYELNNSLAAGWAPQLVSSYHRIWDRYQKLFCPPPSPSLSVISLSCTDVLDMTSWYPSVLLPPRWTSPTYGRQLRKQHIERQTISHSIDSVFMCLYQDGSRTHNSRESRNPKLLG